MLTFWDSRHFSSLVVEVVILSMDVDLALSSAQTVVCEERRQEWQEASWPDRWATVLPGVSVTWESVASVAGDTRLQHPRCVPCRQGSGTGRTRSASHPALPYRAIIKSSTARVLQQASSASSSPEEVTLTAESLDSTKPGTGCPPRSESTPGRKRTEDPETPSPKSPKRAFVGLHIRKV